jgi:hypothetical protein
MEYEKLALEVGAIKAGLTPIAPPIVQGDSGVSHRFTLLFSVGNRLYGFDFYEEVTEIEVVRSYAKKFDSRASVNLVCTSGKMTEGAKTLAVSYDMRILGPKAAETFFVFEPVPFPSSFR